MQARAWTVAAVFCVSISSLGCSKKSDSSGAPPSGFVGITASRTAVVANGTNSVTLTVTDTAGGPVSVSTNRGAFSGGGQTATVPGASGTLTLVTCNATVDAACAGAATVTASHGTSTASVSVAFGVLAVVCAGDCTADLGCASLVCVPAGGGAGTCSSTTPSTCVAAAACTPNPGGATTETSCSDAIDNDCSGQIDCADTGCADRPCQAGAPTFLCKSGVCTDTTSGLAIEVIPARTRLPANGTTTTTVAVKVTSAGEAAPGMGVTLTTDLGTLSSGTGTTGADGTATFTFTTSATPGVATLTALVTAVPQVTRTATVTIPALGSLQIPGQNPVQYPVQGVRGSGWQEFGYVSVLVLDDTGQPYPDGLAVRFEHRRLGGSTLGAPLTADTGTCFAAQGCVGHAGVTSSGTGTDTVGLATAWLYSGTVAGTLSVTATTTAGGVTRTAALPTVAVVGAKASGTNFSIVCSPRNVPALAETDCAISLVDAPFTCEALLKDRYNNLLGTATQVIFASEAAAVGQVTTTPAYDPTQDPAGQADLGIAVQIFSTLGAGLPFDVPPIPAIVGPPPVPGEPSVLHGLDGCGDRSHNPRDGVVTIIAVADGEEAFFDANGNGVYDAAPAAEPFVDQGEPFVDQDDSGAWEPGEWFLDVDGDGDYTLPNGRWDAAAKIWTQTVVVYTGVAATLPVTGGNLLGTRWFGAGFVNACTADAVPIFAVHPSVTGPPLVPATSQTFGVVASDMNLNQLHTGTTYDVAVEGGAKVLAEYNGLTSYADDLGFVYRYWPCDRTGACASQCRATGTDAPCVMTPDVADFSCGIASSVTITGGSAPDPGTVFVDFTVDVPWKVYGGSKVSHGGRAIAGTNAP